MFFHRLCTALILTQMATPSLCISQIAMWSIPTSSSFSLGEPVFVAVTLENLTDADLSVNLGGDGTEAFLWKVTDPSGKQTVYRFMDKRSFAGRIDIGYFVKTRTVPALGSLELTLILNERGGFSVPGVYHVVLESDAFHLVSEFDVRVTSHDGQRLHNACLEFSGLAQMENGEDRDLAYRAFQTIALQCPIPVLAEVAKANAEDVTAIEALRNIGSREAAEVLMALLPVKRGVYRLLVRSSLETIARRTGDSTLRHNIQSLLLCAPTE